MDAQSSTIRQEKEVVEARVAENDTTLPNQTISKEVTVKQNTANGPPEFNVAHKLLVVETWHYVQDHASEVLI